MKKLEQAALSEHERVLTDTLAGGKERKGGKKAGTRSLEREGGAGGAGTGQEEKYEGGMQAAFHSSERAGRKEGSKEAGRLSMERVGQCSRDSQEAGARLKL